MGRPYYLILRRGRTPPLCGTYDLASGEEAKSSSSCLGMGTEGMCLRVNLTICVFLNRFTVIQRE